MYPDALAFGLDLSSSISATNDKVSSKSSIPSPFNAETSTTGVSPPRSSAIISYFVKSAFTNAGFASGRSHLFTATTIGTPAAFE